MGQCLQTIDNIHFDLDIQSVEELLNPEFSLCPIFSSADLSGPRESKRKEFNANQGQNIAEKKDKRWISLPVPLKLLKISYISPMI